MLKLFITLSWNLFIEVLFEKEEVLQTILPGESLEGCFEQVLSDESV